MSTWAEQRRADRAAEREQDRLDALALADRQAREREQAATTARDDRAERRRARDRRQAQVAARRAARSAWLAGHAVDLLVYPLALVSAVMAVPAMAVYGHHIYGNATGVVLPVLSELGMWAFALAVMVSRRRHPDRPTAMLTAGIVVFALVGAGLNFAHGLEKGVANAVVMAVVSVAGVAAHQLAVAAPPRSRAERTERRIARCAERRVVQARRVATRRAVVELSADGAARMVYAPGLYVPRRRRLDPATVPGLPVAAAESDGWDAALAALLDGPVELAGSDPTTEPDQHESTGQSGQESGSVAVLDPPPVDPPPADPPPAGKPRPVDPQARRKLSPDEATEAARRIARKHGRPVTAEQIRKALKVGAATARTLRDTVNAELYGGAS